MTLPTKICATCGREMTWRKAWADSWDEVKFCSKRCRRHKPSDTDHALEQAILDLLSSRGRGKTICPSEAARTVAEDWRPLMERARQAARRLVARDALEIVQKGRVVDPSDFRGPIRLRLP